MPPRPKKICQIQGQQKLTFISISASEDASVVGGKPKEKLTIDNIVTPPKL